MIEKWGVGEVTPQQLRDWALYHFFPAHQELAPGHPDHQGRALCQLFTEFELAPPTEHRPAGWPVAINFLNTSEEDWDINYRSFLASCFGHQLH